MRNEDAFDVWQKQHTHERKNQKEEDVSLQFFQFIYFRIFIRA